MMEISPSNLDERLRAAILAVLATEVQTVGTDLRVGVLNGIVHLAGSVDSLQKRTRAEELVHDMQGVRGVVNRIEAPGGPSPAREINLDLKTQSWNCMPRPKLVRNEWSVRHARLFPVIQFRRTDVLDWLLNTEISLHT